MRLEHSEAEGFAAFDRREGDHVAGVQVGDQVGMAQGAHEIDIDLQLLSQRFDSAPLRPRTSDHDRRVNFMGCLHQIIQSFVIPMPPGKKDEAPSIPLPERLNAHRIGISEFFRHNS